MRRIPSIRAQLCLLIVLLGIAQGTHAQNLSFEQKLPGWLKENNVLAAGVGIIENGKLKYAKVFGELRKGGPTSLAWKGFLFESAKHWATDKHGLDG